MRAIVTGMIATYPVGGVVWDYGQYALALEDLGFEVYYLEDTGWLTYDPEKGEYTEDCSYGVGFLRDALTRLSPTLSTRWHFRDMNGNTYGIPAKRLEEVVGAADLLLNVSGGSLLRDSYMECRRKVLIDTDPGWNHFRNYPRWDRQPNWYGTHGYRRHDFFFTYAERIGRPDCALPDLGIRWHPTRPPVVTRCWPAGPPGSRWTTVLTWKNFQEPIVHDGKIYGTKEVEFERIQELPRFVGTPLEIAAGGSGVPVDTWRQLGWNVVDSVGISRTAEDYRAYIQASRGEFSVAKNVYVATRSGWFSCRTVCYLSAGRPAVVQDTGFSELVPCGQGLLAFRDLAEARDGILAVEADYARHQRAAREVAEACFGATKVLSDLLHRIGL